MAHVEKVCPHCQALVLADSASDLCPACGEPLGDGSIPDTTQPAIRAPDAMAEVGTVPPELLLEPSVPDTTQVSAPPGEGADGPVPDKTLITTPFRDRSGDPTESTVTGAGAAVPEEPADESSIWADLPVKWEEGDDKTAPSHPAPAPKLATPAVARPKTTNGGAAPAAAPSSAPKAPVRGLREFLDAVGPPVVRLAASPPGEAKGARPEPTPLRTIPSPR